MAGRIFFLAILLIGGFTHNPVFAAISVFQISPTTITSIDDVVTVFASGSGLSDNTHYLQVGITKEGATNYFGYTKNNADQWVKYQTTPSLSGLFSFVPVSGSWSGQLQTKIDPADPDYKGSGNYLVKLLKYISSPNSHTDSNTVNVSISVPVSSPSPPSPTPTPGPTPPSPPSNTKETINWSPSNKASNLGEIFSLSVKLENFGANTSYYLKIRAGLTADKLTKGKTKNGEKFLSDTDSWVSFPKIRTDESGGWRGNLEGRIESSEPVGSYFLRVRVRDEGGEAIVDSPEKSLEFLPAKESVAYPVEPAMTKEEVNGEPVITVSALGTTTENTAGADMVEEQLLPLPNLSATLTGKLATAPAQTSAHLSKSRPAGLAAWAAVLGLGCIGLSGLVLIRSKIGPWSGLVARFRKLKTWPGKS